MLLPSSLNCTFAMPVGAAASAATITLEETVVRCPGDVIDTVTGGGALNVAVTVVLAFASTVQVPVPLHPPLQPPKVEPEAGVAVRVTGKPLAYITEHEEPHAMPTGVLSTVPLPVPAFATVSV